MDRVSETQLQVGENSNWIIFTVKGLRVSLPYIGKISKYYASDLSNFSIFYIWHNMAIKMIIYVVYLYIHLCDISFQTQYDKSTDMMPYCLT